MMQQPVYNTIGTTYNSTRRADAYISSRLHALLAPAEGGKYFDIGCGTGNYTRALTGMGLNMTGIEPSGVMIEKATADNPGITFVQAAAESIPLADATFDGGIGTFTIHHWNDMQKGLREIHRIMKPGGRFVLLSFTPEQLMGYWLCHYFPRTMRNSAAVVSDIGAMTGIFEDCDFTDISTEKYFVHEGLTDHFLYSNKYRPAAYLDPDIRSGVSSFRIYADEAEVQQGLVQLEEDIRSGAIDSIIQQYENDLGDYLFYHMRKA